MQTEEFLEQDKVMTLWAIQQEATIESIVSKIRKTKESFLAMGKKFKQNK